MKEEINLKINETFHHNQQQKPNLTDSQGLFLLTSWSGWEVVALPSNSEAVFFLNDAKDASEPL